MFRNPIGTLLLVLASLAVLHDRTSAEVRCGIDHAVIDGVNRAYGQPIEAVGVCIETDCFDLSYGVATMKIVRIGGRANQDDLTFHLHAQPANPKGKRKNGDRDEPVAAALKAMKPETWYRIHGFLADGNEFAAPPEFSFVVDRVEAIPAAPLILSDFIDREINVDGKAKRDGRFRFGDEIVTLDPPLVRPESLLGKKIGVRGVVRRDATGLRIERAHWRFVRLEDQIGRSVSLDGRLWRCNDHWWFDYRGTKLYITDAQGHLPQGLYGFATVPAGNLRLDSTTNMPAAASQRSRFVVAPSDHGRRVQVSGKLVRQLRPSLEQITEKSDRDLVSCYVIRNATLKYLEPEDERDQRFRTLYSSPFRMVDGVPELLAEGSIRRNILGNETTTTFYRERNWPAIEWTLRHVTPTTLDVLAKRLADPKMVPPLRLLYAAMLAAANDVRGRAFLLKAIETQNKEELADALYCLGAVAWLMPEDVRVKKKTELGWAEPALLELMSRRDSRGKPATAEMAMRYTCIPAILASFHTAASRRVLMDLASMQSGTMEDSLFGTWRSPCLRAICEAEKSLPDTDLRRLEEIAKSRSDRECILAQFLKQDHPDTVRLFLRELEDSSAYMDFREHLTPQMLKALESNLGRVSTKAKTNIEMLLILGQKDPLPSLIARLDDAKWKDKNFVMYELARLADPRAVAPVATKLRDAPADYFQFDPERESRSESGKATTAFDPDSLAAGMAVQHAIEAIAATESKEAVAELIRLLNVDLGRFGGYIHREGFRRIIAEHLIELTGESFGVDADAWRKWHERN
jgi:hypothetical protein